jgi:PiT family inorganic phosphate transporter
LSVSIILQLVFVCCLAVYVAWNLGANDVANSMGTSVGSKAITLKQAIIIAGILEFTGALFLGREVSVTLATKIANPNLFIDRPQIFLQGMISVLIACGLWLQIATSKGLPVASSHAVVGAISGFSWVALGREAIDWSNIGSISLGWLITPIMSGIVAAIFYSILNKWLLITDNSQQQLQEWIPWLSVILVGIFGIIVLPEILKLPFFDIFPIPKNTLALAIGSLGAIGITVNSWQQLARNDNLPKNRAIIERVMGKFQVISACFVAFAHGSNDVGNAIAPLVVIVYIIQNNSVPLQLTNIPYWILILGGLGIVLGLAVQGKKVIATVGENIITLVPSSGFCAEIATATTILLASRMGLPVSTSHALVGSVVGIGLISSNQKVQWSTIKSVVWAWLITLPVAAILSAIVFYVLTKLPLF